MATVLRRAALLIAAAASSSFAQTPATSTASAATTQNATRRIEQVMPKVVAWRRDIHQNPELGNREVRTAKVVADHLRSLGMEVKTGVAHTGVVGLLRGGKPGPVVALRADMDALPVTEQVDLPFASKVRTTYNGQEVGVMHACGHDNHVAILMGVAEVLAGMKSELAGSVKFIFQPAEEGAPEGEQGGAKMMLDEGVFTNPAPEVIFGLHVWPDTVGRLTYREGGSMAASDGLRIVVRGKQTHGAAPWGGVDPIVVSAQVINALQAIPSRQMDITAAPSIVTVGMIQGGIRGNIIPDSVVMVGTIRTFDTLHQKDIHARIKRTVEKIAEAAGATAEVSILLGYPVTFNDPALTRRMAPTLARVARDGKAAIGPPITGAEDFSFFQQKVPGLYFFLGVVPDGVDPARAPKNHSPLFFADEKALPVGVRALTQLTLDYMAGGRVVQ
ncbi:MAG TPA: amidohydrolase [Gemmatimonadaceae bacterium]|nr:amidohydrolase [Gemmatimonadaceae bacterium]